MNVSGTVMKINKGLRGYWVTEVEMWSDRCNDGMKNAPNRRHLSCCDTGYEILGVNVGYQSFCLSWNSGIEEILREDRKCVILGDRNIISNYWYCLDSVFRTVWSVDFLAYHYHSAVLLDFIIHILLNRNQDKVMVSYLEVWHRFRSHSDVLSTVIREKLSLISKIIPMFGVFVTTFPEGPEQSLIVIWFSICINFKHLWNCIFQILIYCVILSFS